MKTLHKKWKESTCSCGRIDEIDEIQMSSFNLQIASLRDRLTPEQIRSLMQKSKLISEKMEQQQEDLKKGGAEGLISKPFDNPLFNYFKKLWWIMPKPFEMKCSVFQWSVYHWFVNVLRYSRTGTLIGVLWISKNLSIWYQMIILQNNILCSQNMWRLWEKIWCLTKKKRVTWPNWETCIKLRLSWPRKSMQRKR